VNERLADAAAVTSGGLHQSAAIIDAAIGAHFNVEQRMARAQFVGFVGPRAAVGEIFDRRFRGQRRRRRWLKGFLRRYFMRRGIENAQGGAVLPTDPADGADQRRPANHERKPGQARALVRLAEGVAGEPKMRRRP